LDNEFVYLVITGVPGITQIGTAAMEPLEAVISIKFSGIL
jgi:hypothetical protein